MVPGIRPTLTTQRIDKETRLLMRKDGPRFVNLCEVSNLRSKRYRQIGNTYITMDFANDLAAQAMLAKSSISGTAVKMAEVMTRAGSELTSLMPSGHPWWASALEATFLCPASDDLWTQSAFSKSQRFGTLSFLLVLKLCFRVGCVFCVGFPLCVWPG